MIKCTRPNKDTEKTIKEWELEKGIRLRNTKGFPFSRNKVHSQKFTDKFFRECAKNCTVKCKTEKGLKFLNKRGGK